jgi:glycerol-3-phosphate dehydrogenase
MLQLTRGIHIVVPHRRLPVNGIVILKAPDGRAVFVAPREGFSYVGTTDTLYEGRPEEPGVSKEDAAYLLASLAEAFDDPPTAADIVGTWSGVRPLLRQEGKRPSEISRRDELVVGPGPMVSVAGGKLTTYRRMAEKVMEAVLPMLPARAPAKVDSSTVPLSGGDAEAQRKARRLDDGCCERGLAERLWTTYGIAASSMLARISTESSRAESFAGFPSLTMAEVEHFVGEEMVVSLDDLLRRRSHVAMFDTAHAVGRAGEAARIIGGMLGWGQARIDAEGRAVAERGRRELAEARGENT